MSDVFLSYARKQIEFVRTLQAALHRRSRDVWVDWRDIPPTAEWLQEVFLAIDEADSFLFVISPDSIASTVCKQEIRLRRIPFEARALPVDYNSDCLRTGRTRLRKMAPESIVFESS